MNIVSNASSLKLPPGMWDDGATVVNTTITGLHEKYADGRIEAFPLEKLHASNTPEAHVIVAEATIGAGAASPADAYAGAQAAYDTKLAGPHPSVLLGTEMREKHGMGSHTHVEDAQSQSLPGAGKDQEIHKS